MKTIIRIIHVVLVCSCAISCYSAKEVAWQKKTLSESEKERLFAVAKIYNYLHYFYPTTQTSLAHSDNFKFLIYAVQRVDTCRTEASFERTIYDLFSPLCRDLIVNDTIGHFEKQYAGGGTPFYMHNNRISSQYSRPGLFSDVSRFDTLPHGSPTPDSLYSFTINEHMKISFPLALTRMPPSTKAYSRLVSEFRKIKIPTFTIPWMRKVFFRGKGHFIAFDSYANRVANEIIRYGIIQHFYPYYEEDGLSEKWDVAFQHHLGNVADCENMNSFYEHICKVSNLINDSHLKVFYQYSAYVSYKNRIGLYASTIFPEIETEICDDKLYVKSVGASLDSCVKKGDIIIKINDLPTSAIIDEKLSHTSYSSKESGLYKLTADNSMFKCPAGFGMSKQQVLDSVICLTLQRPGIDTFKVAVHPSSSDAASFVAADSTLFEMYDDSICYVNLCGKKRDYKDLVEILPQLQKSKGIIFDLRGYPGSMAVGVLAHLADTTVALGNLTKPVMYYPDGKYKQFVSDTTGWWAIAPALSAESEVFAKKYQYEIPEKIHLEQPVVFLSDFKAMSFTETVLDMIKTYHIGTILGEPSAGCNGDMLHCSVPFGDFFMTGYKVANRDGSKHHGIGVLPDIYVKNECGFDIQKEKAKAYLYEKLGNNHQ